jgi:glycosyltransferase involved in cell wall biosynthesis
MSVKVATNWADKGLVRALREHGIHVVFVKNMSLNMSLDHFDLVYYARFVPPLLDKDAIVVLRKFRNVIYSLHAPLTIDNPIKPTHALYDLMLPPQIYALYLKGAVVHTLNLDDYRLLEAFCRKLIYMPLGVDTEMFRCRVDKPDIFTIIYASRPTWHKGTDLLVNYIMPMILKKLGDEVRIVITESTSDFLSYLYDKVKGTRHIELYEHLPATEYAKLLSEAHVLLFPSRYESFARIILDALASGVIPIAFNVRGSVRDILLRTKLNRYVVKYPDLTGFVSRVIELYRLWYRNPNEYRLLSMFACKVAEQYSWAKIGRLWAETFKLIAFGEHGV